MRKQWVLVGILAGSLCAGPALAQHKAPNTAADDRRRAGRADG